MHSSVLHTPRFFLASSLDPVEEVLVVRNALTARFVTQLEAILPRTGVRLHPIDCGEEPSDLWIQDAVEIGRLCTGTERGIEQNLAILSGLRAGHDRNNIHTEPLDTFVREHFRSLGASIIEAGVPRTETRWIDWFGNLEVSPPVTARSGREFPYGRVLTGVQNGLGMHPGVLAFLEAQAVQTPALALDVSWLTIGHVDETINFVPAPDGKGFRALLPDPALARNLLAETAALGHGQTPVFAGHKEETTVTRLLDEVARSEEQQAIEQVLRETRALLHEELGLDDEDCIGLPALFQNGIAVIPNMVNSLVCNGHLVIPIPLGPTVYGEDIFAEAALDALLPLGLTLHFVDIWEPYHVRAGEIHCGTNAIRRLRAFA